MKGNGGERAPTARRAAAPAEAPPAPRRRARAVKVGLRLLLLLGTSVALYVLFPTQRGAVSEGLERGVVAPEDVVAGVAFDVPKPPEELRREQDEAASGVPPVLERDSAAERAVAASLAEFFSAVDSAAAGQPDPRPALRATLERARVPVTLGAIEVLADPARRAALRASSTDAAQSLLARGVASASPRRSGVSAVNVRGLPGGERLVAADSVLTADAFYRLASAGLVESAGADAAELQRLLLIRFFRPSLVPDADETERARARARAAVNPVKARVLAGEKIVGAREQVGPREEERLRAYEAALRDREVRVDGPHSFGRALGGVLHNALLLCILGALLRLSRRTLWDDDRAVTFLAMLVIAVSGIAAVVARLELPPEVIPVPFAALLVAVLWGGRLALALALVLALLLGGQGPFVGLAVPFATAVGGAAAAFGVRVAQRRLQAWLVVVIIAMAYGSAALSVGLLRDHPVREIGIAVAWGIVNATASVLLAVGVLPLAEWFTRVTTNQTLMELADPNQPLLRRLALEAPGTYAHTISVANLAEAVCTAIGANALLARVGVYYHDVGKVVKPHYFIENQPRGRNPHDKLKPSMSAAVVRSHVADGLKLAEQVRLPAVVKAFIAEHHGTQAISYFLDQARAADPEARVNTADFTYAGPRPQSRETAVVMLADSVESAARTLNDPTPERIRELVERLVSAKIASGQLDECPLTLREIQQAKETLVKGLVGMYHHRVDYPAPPAAATPAAEGSPAAAGAGKGGGDG